MYQDYDTIKANWVKDTTVSGRNIYNYLDNFTEDVELTFKLKDSVPNSFFCGFGRLISGVGHIKGAYFRYNRSNQVWFTESTEAHSATLSNTVTTNTVWKLSTENLHKINFYLDDTIVAYRNTSSNLPLTIRIDDFTASPLNLEYLKVKPL